MEGEACYNRVDPMGVYGVRNISHAVRGLVLYMPMKKLLEALYGDHR